MQETQHTTDCTRIEQALAASASGIRMDIPAKIISSKQVYKGAIFSVEERVVELTNTAGEPVRINRQVVRHAPAVVMLVHDESRDMYLVEREYRAGNEQYAYGLPAGLIDANEDPKLAALRELQEETGVIFTNDDDVRIEHVNSCYSSEGMTNELAHIFVIHAKSFDHTSTHFDADEHVASAWATWNELMALPIRASNSVIALQHEQLRRALLAQ
ncbi:NTP pyrophosphohydrolase [Bifidobacterium dolichotidis]|uniref:NTP pyrophosphohydrolase n=1 Tax=Bifidobacterium dolichotidis TaxID=2306976 RepID=A0A430FSS1_9BIFI|nr:NUDIX hydrolase [Bifidobacterium dolichotidis]RSX55901.1 NTP pyrophosphohydrolase [Bifidobacterium dolichotidis]